MLLHPDNAKADSCHEDADRAMYKVNEWMQRAQSAKELAKRVKEFKLESDKTAYTQWHYRSASLVKDEVALLLHENEIRLKFTPTPTYRADYKHGDMIRGTYQAMVLSENGEYKIHDVANNWVEDNFTPECLAMVQRIAMETQEVVYNKTNSKKEIGYLDMQNERTKMIYDNRQISKI